MKIKCLILLLLLTGKVFTLDVKEQDKKCIIIELYTDEGNPFFIKEKALYLRFYKLGTNEILNLTYWHFVPVMVPVTQSSLEFISKGGTYFKIPGDSVHANFWCIECGGIVNESYKLGKSFEQICKYYTEFMENQNKCVIL